ncbi:DUF3267 domain-containing protein [Dyadobacter psychrotolerans]|uniref:DUF3267 domain-containing protein n=1 Tax=Dyadobacter psychrotolerans TaxID=2541721 RepID=A0A4R5E079_9BACT|nr:DUF3267 domain-containing protein [Dyadobacter psychrotolerans]TDE18240.1 DUF3267 domain-containing protein [Dyadobacter psychrotolerans]
MKNQPFDLTISPVKAQVYSLIPTIILIPVMLLPFHLIWKIDLNHLKTNLFSYTMYGLAMLVTGTLIHELIHGLTAVWYAKVRWKNIKFGFHWQSLTPYFHSELPMTAAKYRIVVIMPLIILGIIPYLVSLLNGSGWLLTFGMIFTFAACGDLMIIWMMRKLKAEENVRDHPSEVGLIVGGSK